MGCRPGQRRFVDPSAARAVLFGRRGCGRGRPLASEPDADLRANTTAHLAAGVEALRRNLGVERWAVVLGPSWGTTLGPADAEAHPGRVDALVLGLVSTTSRREGEWISRGVGRLSPIEWDRFAAAVPERLRHPPPVDAYAGLLFDAVPAVRDRAARAWWAWEDAHVSLAPGHRPNPRCENPPFHLRFARLVTHYWRHAAFLAEDQLVRDAPTLDGIPGVLIHGRDDVSSPLEAACWLSRRRRTGELRVLGTAGHGGVDTLLPTILGALDRFAAT